MEESKVELHGFIAEHYDTILNVFSLGTYSSFIRKAIAAMNIQPSDHIIDFGCGTGRNSCLMAKYLSNDGKIMGLDIGEEMIEQFEENCRQYPNVQIQDHRIDEPLPIKQKFDKAFISFVLHGFHDDKKEVIFENVKRVLKPGGQFFILDHNEYDFEKKPFWFRWGFQKFECPLALDFLKVDWKQKLSDHGFENFEEHYFYWNLIRLLKANLGS